jgi:Na+/H+ antiporter NhaD/arsenite permease-like protein
MPFPRFDPYWPALVTVIITIVGIAVGRFPRLRMNRATIALTGATILIVLGALSLDEAYAALDLNTLSLLFAMMVLNAHLRRGGFFEVVAEWVVRWANSPPQLLALTILVAGLFSAIFLNDAVVLIFTPLLLQLCRTLEQPPIPYLMGLATAANIGSVATITGNPQNMIIGLASQIRYLDFLLALGPVALVGMAVAWLVIMLIYRQPLRQPHWLQSTLITSEVNHPLLRKSLLATAVLLIALVFGVTPPLAALGAIVILLITRHTDPDAILREVDWSLLVFFSGLFMVTGALERVGVSEQLFQLAQPLAAGGVAALSAVAVVLSNLISNVPAVLLFAPFVPQLPNPTQSWLTLAMATTLAGNLTLLGSVANLIVAESARQQGTELTFGEYLKAGLPVTLFSLLFGIFWLQWWQ